MTRPYRIVIWGAGRMYYAVVNTILSIVEKGQAEVLGIMADSLPQNGVFDGFHILPKEALCSLEFDYLLLCLKGNPKDAIQSIVETYGVPREMIIRSCVMQEPHFDLERYIRLRESNVTIVSDLCWGGFMYRRLDLRCMSPFRNLFIHNDDYLRLLGDLREYCGKGLVHVGFKTDPETGVYPVMRLGDVELRFNHAKTPEEAASQWHQRIDRINWDNLFIMMHTEDREHEHAFNELEGYEKMICFVPYETSEPHSFRLIQQPSEPFHGMVNLTAYSAAVADPFDPVKLLLGEPDFAHYKLEENCHA